MKQKVSLRYSKALFLLGGSGSEQEKRVKTLEEATFFLQSHPEVHPLLSSPQIRREDKDALLRQIFKGTLDKRLLNFLQLLLDKKRLNLLPEITALYHEIVNENFGIRGVRLITAVPIDPKLKQRLKEQLEQYYQKTVEIFEEVDAGIIGGAILVVGNMMLDCSVRERLAKLKEDLLAVTF